MMVDKSKSEVPYPSLGLPLNLDSLASHYKIFVLVTKNFMGHPPGQACYLHCPHPTLDMMVMKAVSGVVMLGQVMDLQFWYKSLRMNEWR